MSKSEIIYIGDGLDQPMFEKIVLALRKYKSVKFGKFGTFRLVEMKERKAVDLEGKEIVVEAQRTVKFKASAEFKRIVQKKQV